MGLALKLLHLSQRDREITLVIPARNGRKVVRIDIKGESDRECERARRNNFY